MAQNVMVTGTGRSYALIMNISSEAGSISKCYRTNLIDYGMAKAALNMATMNLVIYKNHFTDLLI